MSVEAAIVRAPEETTAHLIAADQFIAKLKSMWPQLVRETIKNTPTMMRVPGKEAHGKATKCCECKLPFGSGINMHKVAHHDHKTGKYIGACHSLCYFKMQPCKINIRVYFHNAKWYDIKRHRTPNPLRSKYHRAH